MFSRCGLYLRVQNYFLYTCVYIYIFIHINDINIKHIFFFSQCFAIVGSPAIGASLDLAQEAPQPESISKLPQPPILLGAGPAHMVVYARNKAGQEGLGCPRAG